MSRSKYTKEEKIMAIQEYELGIASRKAIADRFQINVGTFDVWRRKYNDLGDKAFASSSHNKSYSRELKLSAIADYNNGMGSYWDISIKYGITNQSMLEKWIKKYNGHKEIKDYNPSKGVYPMKARKVEMNEKIEIVLYCIENKYNYNLCSNKFKVNYSQVYNWVKKYEKYGKQGLVDNRGCRKIETMLSDEDKKNIEIRQLKKVNKRLEMENDILKKLDKIERRPISQK